MFEFDDSVGSFLSMLTPLTADDFIPEPAPVIEPGSIYRIADQEFIVLESFMNGTSAVIRKDLLPRNRQFGNDADWKTSSLRSWLNNRYYQDIVSAVGAENVIQFRRNLISMDGLDDYGSCEDYISLLSVDEYRRYHRLLGVRPNYTNWWWLCSPFSTPDGGYSRSVCCVSSDGFVYCNDCVGSSGVRPFFLLNSSVLTS